MSMFLLAALVTCINGKAFLPDSVDDGLAQNFKVPGLYSNLNGCPAFSSVCPTECTDVNSQGCLVCSCKNTPGSGTSNEKQNSSSTSLSHTGSGNTPSGNNNGCPSFPKSCATECTNIDEMGCVVCNCHVSTGLTGSMNQLGTGSSSSISGNNNGCQSFPKSCQTECTKIDDMGCIICGCSGKTSNATGNGPAGISSGASFALGVACPPFNKDCDAGCVSVDNVGCIVCACPGSATNMTSAHAQTANGGSGCPILDTTCATECVTVDSVGCIKCSCPSSNSGSVSFNGCPSLQKDCPPSCLTINPATGCVLCSCGTAKTVTTSAAPVVCPEIYVGGCHNDCLRLDNNGCVICTCSGSTVPSSVAPTASSATSATSITSVTAVSPTVSNVTANKPTQTQVTMVTSTDTAVTTSPSTVAPTTKPKPTATPSSSSSGNNGGCPSFTFEDCDAACVKIDRMGCLSCHCITASPGQNTDSPSSGTQNIPGICAPFDADSCDLACVTLDDNGCFSCECTSGHGTSDVPTTPSSDGGNVHPGGCPSFDPMTCAADCVQMDNRGCMSCTCTTSVPTGPTTTKPSSHPSGSGNVHPGGCPSFNPMTCAADCIQMDNRGCMSCACASGVQTSTSSSQTMTTTPLAINTKAPFTTQIGTKAPIPTNSPTVTPSPTDAPTQGAVVTEAPVITPAPTDNTELCPPVRCSAPCNLGITIDTDGCPKCKCVA